MIELLQQAFTVMVTDLGELWIYGAIFLLAMFIIMSMLIQDIGMAFILSLIPLSLFIMIGLLPTSIAGYTLIGLSVLFTLAIGRLFIR